MLDRSIFIKTEPINKGWSDDKKFCVTKEDGTRLLLRISSIEQYNAKKMEFEMMQRLAALDIPICLPIEFGTCDDGVFSLQSFIDGDDAENIIPLLSNEEQYLYGVKSGELLQRIHTIPAPQTQPPWGKHFTEKAKNKIRKYNQCGIKFSGDHDIIAYVNANYYLLEGRPQTFQHGDYHIGNMMISRDKMLTIIDFNRFDFGDPWEEFNRIVWSAQNSQIFASGMVNGYFGGRPPLDFWKLLAFYISSNTLSSIYWAIPFGQGEVDTMLNQSKDLLEWYDGMRNPIPTWYCESIT